MKKNDIVYILKENPPVNELRYSIRSVVKYFPYSRIIFAGGCPKEIIPDRHISVQRAGGAKWRKATNNIKAACLDANVSEDFWLFNDDFFVMKPVKAMHPIFHGTLENRVKEIYLNNGRNSDYARRLDYTNTELKHLGFKTLNYAVHIPMLVNKEKALQVFGVFPNNPMFRSLYGNYWDIGGRDMKDVKVNIIREEETSWNKRSRFLSTSNKAFNEGTVGNYIRESFPEPTRYERG